MHMCTPISFGCISLENAAEALPGDIGAPASVLSQPVACVPVPVYLCARTQHLCAYHP